MRAFDDWLCLFIDCNENLENAEGAEGGGVVVGISGRVDRNSLGSHFLLSTMAALTAFSYCFAFLSASRIYELPPSLQA